MGVGATSLLSKTGKAVLNKYTGSFDWPLMNGEWRDGRQNLAASRFLFFTIPHPNVSNKKEKLILFLPRRESYIENLLLNIYRRIPSSIFAPSTIPSLLSDVIIRIAGDRCSLLIHLYDFDSLNVLVYHIGLSDAISAKSMEVAR